MVADVGVMDDTETAEMDGGALDPPHVNTVIEYGGRVIAELGSKFDRVVEVVDTTFEFSLVSVMLAEVSCCIVTVPVGA